MAQSPADQLSHTVNVAVLPARGLRIKLEADEAVRALLAHEANALRVDRFNCELLLKRWHKNGVIVTGEVSADITQECVVTLEPVHSRIFEEIERLFVPDGSKLTKPRLNNEGELVIDFDGKDEPEPFCGDTLNAWEIAIEHFLLGVDPFPRKEGVELDDAVQATNQPEHSEEKPNPFAVLKDYVAKKK